MGNSNRASHIAIAAAFGVGLWLSSAGLAAAADPGQGNPADGWGGFYLGVAGGPQFEQGRVVATSVGPANIYGVDAAHAKFDLGQGMARIGGYVGWNYVFAPKMLVGAEGDVAGIMNGQQTNTGLPGVNYFGAATNDQTTVNPTLDASLRARFGYAVTPGALLYGTFGGAFRSVDISASCDGSATSWCGIAESGKVTKTMIGWTAGFGVEGKVMDHLSIRFGYRYENFGSANVSFFTGTNDGADSFAAKIDQGSHIAELGLTYHLGGF
jgi:outer membrane immunogenic protein